MKKKRFTKEKITGAIKASEAGEKATDISRRIDATQGMLYN